MIRKQGQQGSIKASGVPAECRKATLCPTLRGRPFCRAKKGVWRGAKLWNNFAVALGITAARHCLPII